MNAGGHTDKAKQQLRRLVRDARCALDAETCASHADSAAENLLALPQMRTAHVVMAYSANSEELDPAGAIEVLHGAGKVIAMPRIEAPGALGIHVVEHGEELEPGPLGIRQPSEGAPRLGVDAVDLVVIPGVAFDASGYRLGYGGGYYDRLLPMLRANCLRVGFAYDEQLVDSLPAAAHDQRVHVIVTPSRVIHADFSAGPMRDEDS